MQVSRAFLPLGLLTLCGLAGLACPPPAHAQYAIVDLGTLPGTDGSFANDINASGQVVGYCYSNASSSLNRAFLFSGGRMVDLGTLPGDQESLARGVNDAGQVVGDSDAHAFLYSAGSLQNLGDLADGAGSQAWAINNSGQVVGNSNGHGFLFSNGQMQDLGAFTLYSINAAGQVAGEGPVADPQHPGQMVTHAFLFSNGTPQDLGALPGGDYSSARRVNDRGQAVGSSRTSSDGVTFHTHAFLWKDGVMQDLGSFGARDESYATGVNASGQVVGYDIGGFPVGSRIHPFLYDNGTMTDLNALLPTGADWVLNEAWAINDAGQIVGTGQTTVGGTQVSHAFLLTPTPTVNSLAPASAVAHGSAFTLTVNGTHFYSSSVVQWNGVPLPTTFVSTTQLTAQVPADDISTAGTAAVTVNNGGIGGASASVPFTITAAVLHTFPAGLQMLSVPTDLSGVGLSAALDGSTAPLAAWNPALLQYVLSPTAPADALRPGQGYWAKFPQPTRLLDLGVPTPTDKPFAVSLSRGWNLIGDPFPSDVSLSNVRVQDAAGKQYSLKDAAGAGLIQTTLYSYPAGSTKYQSVGPTGSLEPFMGYWIHALRPCTLVIAAPGV